MRDPNEFKKDVVNKLKTFSDTVTTTIGDLSKGKSVFCSSSITNQRLNVCKGCEFFVKSTTQCKRCGCFMSAKTRLKKASCPIGKWTKEP